MIVELVYFLLPLPHELQEKIPRNPGEMNQDLAPEVEQEKISTSPISCCRMNYN